MVDLLERLEKKEKKKTGARHTELIPRGRRAAFITVAAVFALVFAAGMIYILRSRTIFFWDDATYWDMSREIAGGELSGRLWSAVYESIGTSDYNYVAALPSALWIMLFGSSRAAYIAGLLTMYILPFFVMVYSLAKKLSKAPLFAFCAAVFSIPAAAYMAFIGFVDVGGLLIMAACYNLYYTRDGTAGKWYRYAAIGVLLVLVMVFRKYFAFFSVSFLTAMAVDCIVFRRKWRYLFITAGVSALLLVTVLFPFLTGILLKDYGTLYSGYKYPVLTDIKLITRYFGSVFIVLLITVPFVSAIRRHEPRPVFVWIQILVCAAMFISTQTHGQQHLLLYMPALAVLVMFLVNNISKQWMLIAVCLLAAVNTLNVFVPRQQPNSIQEIDHIALFPDYSMQPQRRDDTEAILALKRDLDKAIPEGSRCSVLASSFLLNDSILRNVEPSLNVGISRDPDYITALPDVDSRDSWRLGEIYTADYILAAIPAQTHLAAGEQTIVDEAVSSFANGTDIAESFEEVQGFARELDGFEVRLYVRTGEVTLYQQSLYEARLFY